MGLVQVLVRLSFSDISCLYRKFVSVQRKSVVFLDRSPCSSGTPLTAEFRQVVIDVFSCATSPQDSRYTVPVVKQFITFHAITTLQIILLLGLKENILPSLMSLTKTICYRKCVFPKAQLKFLIII